MASQLVSRTPGITAIPNGTAPEESRATKIRLRTKTTANTNLEQSLASTRHHQRLKLRSRWEQNCSKENDLLPFITIRHGEIRSSSDISVDSSK